MNQTSTQYFTALRILHGALCGGVVMFAGIALLLKYVADDTGFAPELQPVLLPLAIGVAVIGIGTSMLLYKKRLEALRELSGLQAKTDAYRAAQIIRWALLEAAALFGIIGLLMTTHLLFLIIAAVPAGLMIASRPTRERGLADMQLSWEEQAAWDGARG